jgi:hypothetical protein
MYPQEGYETENAKWTIEYTLSDRLRFELPKESLDTDGTATILYQADGSIGEYSPEQIWVFPENEDEVIELARETAAPFYTLSVLRTDELQVKNDGR